MDQKELQQKIALYYEKLPEEAKVVFAGMNWIGTLEEIEIKYSLNDEQIKTLGTETAILLLGIIGIEEYVNTIRKEMKLEASVVDKILDEVGEKILNNVMPYIDKAYNDNMSSFIKESTGEKEDYKVKIYEISNKHGLPIDKMGEIQSITERFINGEISSIKYENEISLITEFPSNKILEIIKDINENIINKIRQEAIKKNTVPLPPKKPMSISLPIKSKKEIPLPPKKEVKEEIPVNKIDDNEEYKSHGIEIVSDNTPKKYDPYRETF